MQTPFFGASAVARSTNIADNQCINLYPELVETKDGKNIGALIGAPGLDLVATVDSGPIHALHVLGNYLYVVSNNNLYYLDQNFNQNLIFSDMIFGAYAGNISSGFKIVDLPFSNPLSGSQWSVIDDGTNVGFFVGLSSAQQDQFGLVAQPGTFKFWQSNNGDITTWNALNFGNASADPDAISAIATLNRELFVLKQQHTEVWIDAGLPNFAFQRLDGVYLQTGCVASQSVAVVGETLIFLGANSQGQNIAVQIKGYSPARISTHALESRWASYSTTADAIAYSYQQEGHDFYVISFPSGGETWVYDATESVLAGMPMWHQRAVYQNGNFALHWAQVHAFFNGKNIVGDYRNGNIYAYDLATLTDNGTQRKWLRTWRALPQPVERPVRFPPLRIDMQTGVGIPAGPDPTVSLRWSDDGGHNWTTESWATVDAGPEGATSQRVRFTRLGSTRRASGLDRIFELSSTSQFPVALVGAVFEDEPPTSRPKAA